MKGLDASALLDLEITPLADADLLGIWHYTAETWSIERADTYVDSLHSCVELLCTMPEIAREHVELARSIQIYSSNSHMITYTYDAKRLVVVRVLGQRQDWQAVLS